LHSPVNEKQLRHSSRASKPPKWHNSGDWKF
jgi:hypothetical protein